MTAKTDPYSDHDREQQGVGGTVRPELIDPRSAFKHDRDRVLYSSAFAALAGKTQVVPADELGGYHTRLTHSLKVAQVGRRIAEMLVAQNDGNGPDPDLVETACLAHDIGHPPFGHAGESALSEAYQQHAKDDTTSSARDGFEGNAQNLHILSFLADRSHADKPGLHLTRAALDATIKYPWSRGATSGTGGVDSSKKFGVYKEDKPVATWIYDAAEAASRPVEEQIMDWADDVTYACHDLEDFFRAGFIPLASILAFPTVRGRLDLTQESEELAYFLNFVENKWAENEKAFDREAALAHLGTFSNLFNFFGPFRGSHRDRQNLTATTRTLIRHMLSGLQLKETAGHKGHLVRYGADLVVPRQSREMCALLKELIWCYVIKRPELSGQQRGQKRIVADLLDWHVEDSDNLLPPDRLEDIKKHSNPVRAACDHVASLTEKQATMMHRRMSGTDIGAITDIAF